MTSFAILSCFLEDFKLTHIPARGFNDSPSIDFVLLRAAYALTCLSEVCHSVTKTINHYY